MNKANITTHLCRTHSDRWWTLATTPATTTTRKQGTRSAMRRRDPPWQHLSRDRHRAPLEEPSSRSSPLQKATVTATKVVRLHRHQTWSNLRTQIVSPNRRSRSSPLRRRNRSRVNGSWWALPVFSSFVVAAPMMACSGGSRSSLRQWFAFIATIVVRWSQRQWWFFDGFVSSERFRFRSQLNQFFSWWLCIFDEIVSMICVLFHAVVIGGRNCIFDCGRMLTISYLFLMILLLWFLRILLEFRIAPLELWKNYANFLFGINRKSN